VFQEPPYSYCDRLSLIVRLYKVLLDTQQGVFDRRSYSTRILDLDTTEAGNAAEGDQWRREGICMV
jgi:hypothetical protein